MSTTRLKGNIPAYDQDPHIGGYAKLDWQSLGLIFLSSWPHIRPVLKSLCIYAAGVLFIVAAFAASGFIGFEVLWDSVAQAKPPSELHAKILLLSTANFVELPVLTEDQRYEILWRFIVLTVLLATALTTLGTALDIYKVAILQRINQSLRVTMVNHMNRLSLKRHFGAEGDSVYRVFQDSAMVTAVIETVVVMPIIAILRAFGFLALAFLFSPWFAVLFALGLTTITLTLTVQNKKLREASFSTRQISGQLLNKVQVSIQGLLLSKAFARESDATSEFQALSHSAFDHSLSLRTRIAAMKALTTVTLAIVLLSTDFFAATYVFSEQPVFGASLLVFFGLTSRFWSVAVYQARRGNAESIQVTLEELVNYWCLAQDMAVGLGRTWELLARPPGVEEPKEPKKIPDRVRHLDLCNINYSHDKKLTLKGITLRIDNGKPHLLVGPSGAGKSTLLSLLLRLDDPEKGDIFLDGVSLRDVRLSDLRNTIGIVLQESTVLPLTLRQNIEYTVSDSLSDAEMERILKIACLESVVDSLPNGLDTDLGSDGGLLSTGQRQQVAIARMIAADPKVILMDEPTASLDLRTEKRVLKNLLAWAKEKIVLIVSHQLDIVQSVKQIGVIEEGQIIAQGDHRELLESCELYRFLYQGSDSDGE